MLLIAQDSFLSSGENAEYLNTPTVMLEIFLHRPEQGELQ